MGWGMRSQSGTSVGPNSPHAEACAENKAACYAHPAIWGTLALIAIIIALIVKNAPVRDVSSDPRCSLMVSQSILENGTIKIDSLNKQTETRLACAHEHNGHYYDYFPLGTPVLSLPAVLAARVMGFDMARLSDNASLQKFMVTFIVPVIFVIIFLMGRLYVPAWTALVISVISVLGSSLVSTLGTALWSQCIATLLNALVLLVVVRHDAGNKQANPYLLGMLLFLSYLTRPTACMFIIMVFAYFFHKERKVLIRTAAFSFLLQLGFVAFSYYEYAQALPPYYLGRLHSHTSFFTALYGLLLSPSRGLFVFSPFLIVVTFLVVYLRRIIRTNTLLFLLVLWSLAHVLMTTRFAPWWAGWSFGARIFTESLPAWILLSFILWKEFASRITNAWKTRAVAATYLVLGLIAILINTGQGLYNPWTQLWNNCIDDFDRPESALFSWKTPQVLATSEGVIEHCTKTVNKDGGFFVAAKSGYKLVLLQKDPRSCKEMNERAMAYLKLGYIEKSMEDLEQAVIKFPSCAWAYDFRGIVFIDVLHNSLYGCRDLEKACSLGVCDNLYLSRARGYCGRYSL